MASEIHTVVLVSANAEWRYVRARFPDAAYQPTPYGECFTAELDVNGRPEPVAFLHGGWGKVAAAGSAQYAISRWSPVCLVNLGTCGGFEGEVEPGTILLAERTLIYDIREQMTDPDEAIRRYTTHIDLSWLREPLPMDVRRALLVSADRDLVVEEIPALKIKYAAIAGDWESGAIAHVAARNDLRCLILRGVSDVVGSGGGEVYGDFDLYLQRTGEIMNDLLDALPAWLASSLPDVG